MTFMLKKEISVLLQGHTQKLGEVLTALSDLKVDIPLFTMCEGKSYSIFRFITDAPEKAERAVRSTRQTVSVTNVVTVEVTRANVGGVYSLIDGEGIQVEYSYGKFDGDNGLLVVRTVEFERLYRLLLQSGYTEHHSNSPNTADLSDKLPTAQHQLPHTTETSSPGDTSPLPVRKKVIPRTVGKAKFIVLSHEEEEEEE